MKGENGMNRIAGRCFFQRAKISSAIAIWFLAYTGNPDPIYPLRLSNGGGWGDFLNGDHILDGGQPASTAFPPIPGPQGINCNSLRNSSFHSFHVGGCHFLYADGSIHFVVESIEARALAGQITARNAEVLSKE
jgi:hypothetical protein